MIDQRERQDPSVLIAPSFTLNKAKVTRMTLAVLLLVIALFLCVSGYGALFGLGLAIQSISLMTGGLLAFEIVKLASTVIGSLALFLSWVISPFSLKNNVKRLWNCVFKSDDVLDNEHPDPISHSDDESHQTEQQSIPSPLEPDAPSQSELPSEGLLHNQGNTMPQQNSDIQTISQEISADLNMNHSTSGFIAWPKDLSKEDKEKAIRKLAQQHIKEWRKDITHQWADLKVLCTEFASKPIEDVASQYRVLAEKRRLLFEEKTQVFFQRIRSISEREIYQDECKKLFLDYEYVLARKMSALRASPKPRPAKPLQWTRERVESHFAREKYYQSLGVLLSASREPSVSSSSISSSESLMPMLDASLAVKELTKLVQVRVDKAGTSATRLSIIQSYEQMLQIKISQLFREKAVFFRQLLLDPDMLFQDCEDKLKELQQELQEEIKLVCRHSALVFSPDKYSQETQEFVDQIKACFCRLQNLVDEKSKALSDYLYAPKEVTELSKEDKRIILQKRDEIVDFKQLFKMQEERLNEMVRLWFRGFDLRVQKDKGEAELQRQRNKEERESRLPEVRQWIEEMESQLQGDKEERESQRQWDKEERESRLQGIEQGIESGVQEVRLQLQKNEEETIQRIQTTLISFLGAAAPYLHLSEIQVSEIQAKFAQTFTSNSTSDANVSSQASTSPCQNYTTRHVQAATHIQSYVRRFFAFKETKQLREETKNIQGTPQLEGSSEEPQQTLSFN